MNTPDSLNECREAFEAWIAPRLGGMGFTRYGKGYFDTVYVRVNDQWEIWKAAWNTRHNATPDREGPAPAGKMPHEDAPGNETSIAYEATDRTGVPDSGREAYLDELGAASLHSRPK